MAIETTNYAKYQTGNPVVRRLIARFQGKVRAALLPMQPDSLLDAGCGEGESIRFLGPDLPDIYKGFDLSEECVSFCQERFLQHEFQTADITALPFEDLSFDAAICLEVLEHLPHPERALAELERVARRGLVLSVPHEPWFQLGSLARGKYLATLGNHPEHIQHWNPASFRRFIRANLNRADRIAIDTAFPWIVAQVRLGR